MIKWPEPVLYQYRWTNPDGGEQPASMLEWKYVEPAWNQTVAQKCDELLAYRYKGEPPYEVRALVSESQLKQAVRDAYEDVLGIDWFELMRNNFDKERSEHIAESIETAIRALIKEIE